MLFRAHLALQARFVLVESNNRLRTSYRTLCQLGVIFGQRMTWCCLVCSPLQLILESLVTFKNKVLRAISTAWMDFKFKII